MADDTNVDATTSSDSTTTGQETQTDTTGTQNTNRSSTTQVTPPANNGADERNRGLLADLQKERKARQDFERRFTESNAALENERRRVQALAGVNPKSVEETEAEEIRQRILKVFPEFGKMQENQRLAEERAQEYQESVLSGHKRHGRQMLDSVVNAVSTELGGKLSPRQTNRLERAYAAEAEANPDFLARHDAGDPTLITDFVKEWLDDFYEPARRKVTQTEVDRQRRVPSGRDRSANVTGGKKIDFTNPQAVEDAMVASFRGHGGGFDRD